MEGFHNLQVKSNSTMPIYQIRKLFRCKATEICTFFRNKVIQKFIAQSLAMQVQFLMLGVLK